MAFRTYLTKRLKNPALFQTKRFLTKKMTSSTGYGFFETFENPSTGLDNAGWTSGGTPGFKYATAPAPLQGTQSIQLANASISRVITGTRILNGYFLLNVTTWQNFAAIIDGQDSAFNDDLRISMLDTNVLYAFNGATNVGGSTTIVPGTTYHIWWEWMSGQGNNGVMKVYVSTTTIKPTVPEINIINGTSTTMITKLFLSGGATASIILDYLVTDTLKPISSNP